MRLRLGRTGSWSRKFSRAAFRQAIRGFDSVDQRMDEGTSSETVLDVPPNEKDGFGAKGRAGGSGTVTEAWVFAWESRHAAVANPSPIKRIWPSWPASPMPGSLAAAH